VKRAALALAIALFLATPAAARTSTCSSSLCPVRRGAFDAVPLSGASTVHRCGEEIRLSDDSITYLAERTELDPARIKLRSTRENVLAAFADLAKRAKVNDEIIVLLIGHGTFDGKTAAFNLPGPDLTAPEYAKLLGQVPDAADSPSSSPAARAAPSCPSCRAGADDRRRDSHRRRTQ
jgi:hypothetical protein